MSRMVVNRHTVFGGEVLALASDKSISHRVAMFSLFADKPSVVYNFLQAEDTLSSLSIASQLGAECKFDGNKLTIKPPKKIVEPATVLNCNNAGTAMRLYAGLLSAQDGFFVLSGDKYLNARTMKRVVDPLRKIGAKIDGREDGNLAPLAIRGSSKLDSFDYVSNIASAQVKSALILAGLFAQKTSYYTEEELTRDHTERMLIGMGANIKNIGSKIAIEPLREKLKPLELIVPADPSSGFFFAVAASIVPNSEVILKGVLLNPTRIEAYKVLQKMGAKIEFIEKENRFESVGDIKISYGELKAIEVSENISWLIDEIPALAIAFALADGKSVVRNAKELRVKETDRIKAVVNNLIRCGIEAKELEDGFEIVGAKQFKSCSVDSYGDHRIAMSFAVAALRSAGEIVIEDSDSINASFPNFPVIMRELGANIEVISGD